MNFYFKIEKSGKLFFLKAFIEQFIESVKFSIQIHMLVKHIDL